MPVFTIEVPSGQRLTIEAPDENTALKGAQEWHTQQSQPKVVGAPADPMGSDGVSGDTIRAANAGNTRSQMRPQDIEAAYDVARGRGDQPEQAAMADAMVQRQRADSPVAFGVGQRAQQFVTGLPVVGGAANKAVAGLAALTGGDYQKAKDYNDALARDFETNHPKESTALQIGGGIAGTVPMIAAAPFAFGAGSAPMAIRMGASALTGGALGGADAAVRSEGDANAISQGALLGGMLGAASPPIAAGVGKVASAIMDKAAPADALSSVPARARDWAVNEVGSPAKIAAMRAEINRLGPEAMLADVSPEWMGVARGAASRPGSRDQVVGALLARDAAKNARINGTINAEVGPAVIPSQVEAGIKANQEAVRLEYEPLFAKASRVDTQPLADTLETQAVNLRGPAQKAVQQVRKMLNVTGTDQLDPNPSTLFQTRQAIDGLIGTEADGKAVAALTAARQRVDGELARAVPGIKDVDAKFEQLALQREGLQRGSMVLDSGKTATRPVELSQEIQQGTQPNGTLVGPSAVPVRMREGARAEIDRIVGQNSNDIQALNRLMKGEGDWNRDKLATLFGADKAGKILSVLDAEQTFQRTAGRVTSGSDTAMAQRFGDFLDSASKSNAIPTDTTATGGALRVAQMLIGAASKSRSEAKAAQFADDLGRLAVAQGANRDAIIQALMARGQGSHVPAGAEQVVRALLASAPPVANQRLLAR